MNKYQECKSGSSWHNTDDDLVIRQISLFRLFGKYHGKSDLLFKDSAKSLKALSEDTPAERKKKKDYFKKLEELHRCEGEK